MSCRYRMEQVFEKLMPVLKYEQSIEVENFLHFGAYVYYLYSIINYISTG